MVTFLIRLLIALGLITSGITIVVGSVILLISKSTKKSSSLVLMGTAGLLIVILAYVVIRFLESVFGILIISEPIPIPD